MLNASTCMIWQFDVFLVPS